MKILHVSTALTWRGGEQQVAYLTRSLDESGIDQVVITPRDAPLRNHLELNGIETMPLQKSRTGMRAALMLGSVLSNAPYDILHVHDSRAHSIALAGSFVAGSHVPIVVSRRVDFPVGQSIRSRRKYTHKNVKAIICVSDVIRRIVADGLDSENRLYVVHSGVDPDRFREGPDGRLRDEYNIPADTSIVGNVAALAPHKDYPTFVEASRIALQRGLRARFLMIGADDGDGAMIRRLVAQHNLERDVLSVGFRNDVERVLPELDCLLFTSKTEGLGTTVIDALAAGVPVVATEAGGIPEIIEHGRSGLLAPVGDAETLAGFVQSVLGDESMRDHLIEAGRARLDAFSIERMADKTLEIYRAVLAEGEGVVDSDRSAART